MDEQGERQSRFLSWMIGGFVIIILTSVSSFVARLLVAFVLAALGAPPWLIGVVSWIVTGAVLVTVILGWRSMQKAGREEEQRGR
jgi:membrane protein implicated in regulation of membrane protease activity